MNVPEREVKRHEAALLHQVFRHGLLSRRQAFVEGRFHDFVHDLSGHSGVLEPFRAWIDSRHASPSLNAGVCG